MPVVSSETIKLLRKQCMTGWWTNKFSFAVSRTEESFYVKHRMFERK